jgi:putative transposase
MSTNPSETGTARHRKHPVHGVLALPDQPTIVFLTVCTKNRVPWLASDSVHELLRSIWSRALAWYVGRYMIMPDHIHLFAAPGTPELPLENWVKYWKSQFSKYHSNSNHRWQTDHWDTRLRTVHSYEEKWNYAVNNSVRHALVPRVPRAEDWPYQGELFELRWQ